MMMIINNTTPNEGVAHFSELAKDTDRVSVHGTVYATINISAKSQRPSPGQDGPPSRTSKVSAAQIQQAIQDFYSKHNETPAVGWIRENLGCGGQRVNDELARFKRDLDRDEVQAAYIGSLVNTPNSRRFTNTTRTTCRNAFRRIRQDLDNAHFALYNRHPRNLALLTLNVPSDSELTFLACCSLADRIPISTIQRLLTKKVAATAEFVWKWEIQPLNRRRLHLHIVLFVPPEEKNRVTQPKLKEAWFHILEHLVDEETRCNPLRSENGADLRGGENLVHFHYPYEEKPEKEQYRHQWGYLAAEHKSGKSVIAVRKLYDELEGQFVMPCHHGGVSPALKAIVDEQNLCIRMPCLEKKEADALTREIKELPLLQHYEFELWGAKEFKNINRTRISREDYDLVRDALVSFEQMNEALHPRLTHEQYVRSAPYVVSIKLEPNRFLKIHKYKRRARA